jgi:bifunctional pyridoxal-dependent enzyme with beta-cystathionase and maltose regulon repressor activities
MYHVIEKKNPLAVHAICHSFERAEYWIKELAPSYCANGFFIDKTLKPNSFKIKIAK